MCIDFYGRFESEEVAGKNGLSRLKYTSVLGGTSVGADSIALLRGAPNPQVAKAFIDFVLKLEGQKLWDFRVGTPGGPDAPMNSRREAISFSNARTSASRNESVGSPSSS